MPKIGIFKHLPKTAFDPLSCFFPGWNHRQNEQIIGSDVGLSIRYRPNHVGESSLFSQTQ